MVAYGFVLEKGSELLAEGSEMLLEFPGASPAVIGGVVLPMLGAVPDAAIVLASSIGGSDAEDLGVAIGTLAGSTIMLLALSMGLIVLVGACDIRNGKMVEGVCRTTGWNKLTKTGVIFAKDVRSAALITCLCFSCYIVIQIPEIFKSSKHRDFSIAGACFCLVVLLIYMGFMVRDGNQRNRRKATADRHRCLRLAIDSMERMADAAAPRPADRPTGAAGDYQPIGDDEDDAPNAATEITRLFQAGERAVAADSNISMSDVPDAALAQHLLRWQARAEALANSPDRSDAVREAALAVNEPAKVAAAADKAWASQEEAEEADEVSHTRWAILRAALLRIVIGTVLVAVFSDPVVDAFKDFAALIHVEPFYVAFFLSPIASNASEFIGSIIFASRKKPELLSMSAASLLGAATMNSTLVLAVFLIIMAINNNEWVYTAEFFGMMVCTVAVTLFVAFKKVIRFVDSFYFIAVYFLSFGVVVFCERVLHFS